MKQIQGCFHLKQVEAVNASTLSHGKAKSEQAPRLALLCQETLCPNPADNARVAKMVDAMGVYAGGDVQSICATLVHLLNIASEGRLA